MSKGKDAWGAFAWHGTVNLFTTQSESRQQAQRPKTHLSDRAAMATVNGEQGTATPSVCTAPAQDPRPPASVGGSEPICHG
jgi:hypothetical protein